MMNPQSPRPRIAVLTALLTALPSLALGLAMSGAALADPPSRVARLASTSGAISFSPGGEDEWVKASVNRPMTSGDRVWADANSRAELQLGDTAIRLGASTSLTLLNLDDRATQLRLAQGRLNLRVRHLDRDESFEVDTPNLAFTLRRPGNYRIEVDPDGGATRVSVREGQAEVAADGNAFVMEPGQAALFQGTGLRDYDFLTPPSTDDVDRWASDRDRRWNDSPSARYVPRDLIGFQDLDDNGSWRTVDGYGPVWQPARVAADWAPYRDGHWAWVEPWGWTWVDAAPWGFAPSHYGRWARIDRDENFEVDTPNLAFTIRRPGNYRIEVDPDGGATRVSVREGQAEVAADGNAFVMEPGQAALFQGTGLRDYDFLTPPGFDDVDRWASDRDRRWNDSPSARYVPRDLIGFQDLDDNGSWRTVDGYGPVWQPARVATDWAPYRDGHWAWVAPWGWTWVDAAPWGFAPSHYGRWARIDRDWCWVPGPVAVRPVYAPALVAFVGGNNFQIAQRGAAVGAVAWFALGPHDVYRPSYPVSRDYFEIGRAHV